MRRLATIFFCLGLAACGGESAEKSGVMPGIATGGYNAPTQNEATASYLLGFERRYNIPELDYPEDIKARIRKARIERFERDMRIGRKRSKMIARLALMALNDPEAIALLEEIKNAPDDEEENIRLMMRLFTLTSDQNQRPALSASQRARIYDKAIKTYKRQFRDLNVSACRWTEMQRLIGSGHDAMAFIHGQHPAQGYRCEVDLTLEKNRGYPRVTSFTGFWVKDQSGEWDYYGNFESVGLKPRRQQLDPDMLRDPEGTIMRQSRFDMIASSFQN
jgi:hypothetical protein